MSMPDHAALERWLGAGVVDPSGIHLGRCTSTYVDDATGIPEWLRVDLIDGRQVLVPVIGARDHVLGVRVIVSHAAVLDAPPVGINGHVTPAQEKHLYGHYGIPHSTRASRTVLPTDPTSPPSGPERWPRLRDTVRERSPDAAALRRLAPHLAVATGAAGAGTAAVVALRRQRRPRPGARRARPVRQARRAARDAGRSAARRTPAGATGARRVSSTRPALPRGPILVLSVLAAAYLWRRRSR